MSSLALRFSVDAHRLIMGVLFLGALWLGALLLPGQAERVAMLERDGLEREALQILESEFANGDRSQRTLFQLTRFYDRQGNVGKARQVRELLAEQRPRDVAVLSDLADFLKQVEDMPAYTAMLSRLIDLKYSEAACRDLVGTYRIRGEFSEELAALEKCRQKGYRRPEDMVRLAQLVATDGDAQQASLLLRGVDDLKRLKTVRERLQLFAVLLDADQTREALRRGVRWSKGARDDGFTLTLIEMLLRANKQDVAIELARDVSVAGDSISLSVAEIMLDKGQPVAAQAYLRGWLDKARFGDQGVAVRFVEASLAADDAETAFKGARKSGFDKLPETTLVALAEALAAIGRRDELEEVSRALSPDAVARSSVLTLAGATAGGAEAAAGATAGEPTARSYDPLAGWRRQLWARLDAENGKSAAGEIQGKRGGTEKANPTVARAKKILRENRKVRRLGISRFKARPSGGQAAKEPPANVLIFP